MPTALIEPGALAPDFALPDQSGTIRSRAHFSGAPLVLYFYPKDDTSACTEEACTFGAALPSFRGIAVVGVSPDDVKSHAKFAAKYKLDFPLLADVPPGGGVPAVCDAFGVWQEKSMYGKKYMGVVRTTYLIAADGRVARRWDKVKVAGHAEEVLAAAAALAAGTTPSSAASSSAARAPKPARAVKPKSAKKKRAKGAAAAGRAKAKKPAVKPSAARKKT